MNQNKGAGFCTYRGLSLRTNELCPVPKKETIPVDVPVPELEPETSEYLVNP